MGHISNRELGRFGIWTFDFEYRRAAEVRQSVHELEHLGWRALWVPELFGREALTHAAFLLSVSEHLHVINGIAQIWGRPARSAYAASLLLADAYPNRHILGLGIGGKRAGTPPIAAMREYLDEFDAVSTPNPAPSSKIGRVLAAYGPRMLELARDHADGAHTYKVNVAHTAEAREILGPSPFLGVEHAVLHETDPIKARAIARQHLSAYVTASNPYNVAKFKRLGYSEDDLADGGSDRLVDDFVFWGDTDTISERLRGHIDAGADHVAIQVIGVEPGDSAMPTWRRLADALELTSSPREPASPDAAGGGVEAGAGETFDAGIR